jgi:outer membrane receptor for ferric coprogen and ferric-rhodotorulic acid
MPPIMTRGKAGQSIQCFPHGSAGCMMTNLQNSGDAVGRTQGQCADWSRSKHCVHAFMKLTQSTHNRAHVDLAKAMAVSQCQDKPGRNIYKFCPMTQLRKDSGHTVSLYLCNSAYALKLPARMSRRGTVGGIDMGGERSSHSEDQN